MAYPKQKELEEALLVELYNAGGKLHLSEIYKLMTERFRLELTEDDLTKTNKSGDNTWRNKIRWLRENLIPKEELIGLDDGVWEIAPKGLNRIGKLSIEGFVNEPAASRLTKRSRKSTDSKNTHVLFRRGSGPVIIHQQHNILQETFRKHLINEFGDEAVVMEENNVDLKVVLSDKVIFCEIKPYTSVEHCIRESLGQVLSYTFFDDNHVSQKIIVAGPNEPDDNEKAFISFISKVLLLEFEYRGILANSIHKGLA